MTEEQELRYGHPLGVISNFPSFFKHTHPMAKPEDKTKQKNYNEMFQIGDYE